MYVVTHKEILLFVQWDPLFGGFTVARTLFPVLVNKAKIDPSAVVMDYDEFSKDDLIGGTQISLYEILNTSTRAMSIHRLLDDRSVSS